MRKYISLLTCFSLVMILSACERNSISLEEAARLAKECGLGNYLPIEDIVSVEKVMDETVLLRRTRRYTPAAEIMGYVYRYQLNDPVIEITPLSCAYRDMIFEDSTYAKASGYWIVRDWKKYGGIDGNSPYVFLLTDLKIANKPAN